MTIPFPPTNRQLVNSDHLATKRWIQAQNQKTQQFFSQITSHAKIEKLKKAKAALKDIPVAHSLDSMTLVDGKIFKQYSNQIDLLNTDDWSKHKILISEDAIQSLRDVHYKIKEIVVCKQNPDRMMVRLSHHGMDKSDWYEYDVATQSFPADGLRFYDTTFASLAYLDPDTILVADSSIPAYTNQSGQPCLLRLWHRGQTLLESEIVGQYLDKRTGFSVDEIYSQVIVSTDGDDYLIQYDKISGLHWSLIDIEAPGHFALRESDGQHLYFTATETTNEYPLGSLLVPDLGIIWKPIGNEYIDSITHTKDGMFLIIRDGQQCSLLQLQIIGTEWQCKSILLPRKENEIEVIADPVTGDFMIAAEDRLLSRVVYRFDGNELHPIAQEKTTFGEEWQSLTTVATSADGTPIQATVICHKDTPFDHTTPTIVYAYGGFGHPLAASEITSYNAWLAAGGAIVFAHIRGGDQYYSEFSKSIRGAHHHLVLEDMAAVLTHIQGTYGLTQPTLTGIMGMSNGGLLVASMMTHYPHLMNAVMAGCPVIDMQRFDQYPPGVSWQSEYGDPNEAEIIAFWEQYTPLNLKADAAYPTPLIVTSIDDDRVVPVHARLLAAKLQKLGKDFYLYQGNEGAHGAYWKIWDNIMAYFKHQLIDIPKSQMDVDMAIDEIPTPIITTDSPTLLFQFNAVNAAEAPMPERMELTYRNTLTYT